MMRLPSPNGWRCTPQSFSQTEGSAQGRKATPRKGPRTPGTHNAGNRVPAVRLPTPTPHDHRASSPATTHPGHRQFLIHANCQENEKNANSRAGVCSPVLRHEGIARRRTPTRRFATSLRRAQKPHNIAGAMFNATELLESAVAPPSRPEEKILLSTIAAAPFSAAQSNSRVSTMTADHPHSKITLVPRRHSGYSALR